MKRHTITPRPDWQARVENLGLVYHSTPTTYWDENAYYEFSADQIDQLEKAANDVHALCLQAVEHILRHDLFERFQVPDDWQEFVADSWERDEHTVYGRFDFAYDGASPPRLLEYNADTPTALLEAAVVQWHWLKDVRPGADQFNCIHEQLIEAWTFLKPFVGGPLHFAAVADNVEDQITVHYLRDTATQGGLETVFLTMDRIGWDSARRRFVDEAEAPIRHMFKLYPWEWLMREEFGPHIRQRSTIWYEPPWKMLLSNKALLPLLWEMFPGHPNLLRAAYAPFGATYVKKPCLSREGANLHIVRDGREVYSTPGDYPGPHVYQEYFALPELDGNHPVLGCWIVGDRACGMGIRESREPVTANTSRFVPHLFQPREADQNMRARFGSSGMNQRRRASALVHARTAESRTLI